MSYGVTSTGFIPRTFAELQLALQNSASTIWPGIDVDPESDMGQLIALIGSGQSDLWSAVQAVYASMNPNEAIGAALDNLYSNIGLSRLDSSPTVVYDVLHWGSAGTLISAGRIVQQSSSKQQYALNADVTISATTPRRVTLAPSAPSTGLVYSVTINGTTYSYTALVTDTKATVCQNLYALLMSTQWTPIYAVAGQETITIDGQHVDIPLSAMSHFSIVTQANAGTYTCQVEGAIPAPAESLDTIITPVSNWASVENPYAGATGRAVETDEEFRTRGSDFYSAGRATETAIIEYIINNVAGVSSCTCTSNRTNATVGALAANSFNVIVGGTASTLDIANAIWAVQPAGIQSQGAISTTIVDSQGNSQTVKFDVPTQSFVWIKVQRALDSTEGAYPADGDNQIKNNIVAWSLAKYSIGRNVYRRDILTPVNLVPGLGDVIILIGNSITSTPPSSYSAVDLTIGATAIATFDISRIIVENHP